MDFINGRIVEDHACLDFAPDVRKAMYDSLAEVLAALHRVDPVAVGLERFGRPTGYIQRQMKTWGGKAATISVWVAFFQECQQCHCGQGTTTRRT